jgi:hypothetical protein
MEGPMIRAFMRWMDESILRIERATKERDTTSLRRMRTTTAEGYNQILKQYQEHHMMEEEEKEQPTKKVVCDWWMQEFKRLTQ